MKKTFCKRMSILLTAVYLIAMLGTLPASALTAEELVSAGATNPGWTKLSALDFSAATAISPWYADEKAHIGAITNGELALWDPAYPANSNDFITLKLGNGKSNALVYSVCYNVEETDRPIELSMVGGGTRALIATLKYDRIEWDMSSDGARTFITEAGGNKTLTLILNTQDDSAAIWLDGSKLGEMPLRVYTMKVGSFTHARIGASGTTGTTAPTITKLSVYDTGSAASLSVTGSGFNETFGVNGPIKSGVTWTERYHATYGSNGSITYEKKSGSESDYMMKIHSNDSSISNLVFMQAQLNNPQSGEDVYFSFDFKVSTVPIHYNGKDRTTRLLAVIGNSEIMDIDFKPDGNLYAVTSKDAQGNSAPMLASGLQKETWYNFAISMNTKNYTFSSKLSRLDGSEAAQERTGITFRTNSSNVKVYRLATEKLQQSMWIDNVKFSRDTDATAYGLMMLKSKNADITVDNAAVASEPKIHGVYVNDSVGRLLNSLSCSTMDTAISVVDKNGVALKNTDKLWGKEQVIVTHTVTGTKRAYTLDTPLENPENPVIPYTLQITDANGNHLPNCFVSESTPYATLTLQKPATGELKSGTLIIAEYDDGGKVVNVNLKPFDTDIMEPFERAVHSIPLSLTRETGMVKAFVLSDDLVPLHKAASSGSQTFFSADILEDDVTWQLATQIQNSAGELYADYSIHDDNYDIDAIFYDGSVYQGKQAKVFAYLGIPKGASAANPVPAVVLVHGGGGRAYVDWVKKWNDVGYAAIAMDLYHKGPDVAVHPYGSVTPFDEPAFLADYENAGMYHAVTAVVHAHSLLLGLDTVDASKTGITGISWGGVTTTITAGIDNRFKFAAPVYGCGYLGDCRSYFSEFYQKDGLTDRWDPANFAVGAQMPMLYVNSDFDAHFSLNSTSLTYGVTPEAYLSVKHHFEHGHIPGWNVAEVYHFAKEIFSGNQTPFVKITNAVAENGILDICYTAPEGVSVQNAAIYYITTDRLYYGGGTEIGWQSVSDYTKEGNSIRAALPLEAKHCYASLTDSNGNIISTPLIQVQ